MILDTSARRYPAIVHGPVFLPEPAYDLWVAGTLGDYLGVPDDGSRIEIIGGDIVVSPGSEIDHHGIVQDVRGSFAFAASRSSSPWRPVPVTNLNMAAVGDGYTPDLLCLASDLFERLTAQDPAFARPDQVGLAIEVTTPSDSEDCDCDFYHERLAKWSGYAREGVPFYLLIDREPSAREATLYSIPDRERGRYRSSTSWPFGEPINIPEPFGIEIPTATWQPWSV